MKSTTAKVRALPDDGFYRRFTELRRLIPALQSELDAMRRDDRRRKRAKKQGATHGE